MLILFKLFLLAAISLLVYLFFFRTQSRLLQRLLVSLTAVVLGVFVVSPNLSTRVALLFGIGRGTDFVFYLSNLLLFFILIVFYIQIQRLHRELTKINRTVALLTARPPKEK